LKARGVGFRSLTEAIDTATATGRAMWQMIGILAELERSLIQERTKVGRAAAVARGVKMGRKPKLTPQQVAHARTLLEQGEDRREIARLLTVSWRTIERALQRLTPHRHLSRPHARRSRSLRCLCQSCKHGRASSKAIRQAASYSLGWDCSSISSTSSNGAT